GSVGGLGVPSEMPDQNNFVDAAACHASSIPERTARGAHPENISKLAPRCVVRGETNKRTARGAHPENISKLAPRCVVRGETNKRTARGAHPENISKLAPRCVVRD